MPNLLNETTKLVDGRMYITTQNFSDGTTVEIIKSDETLLYRKEYKPDGSYCFYNAENIKIEEQTADGIFRKYDKVTSSLAEERYKDGTIKTFHENGKISTLKTADGRYFRYYENGKLAFQEEKDYVLNLYKNGEIAYEFKENTLSINPDFYSFYRLGIKTQNDKTHWSEQEVLSPKKKTLICLGGDQTKDAKSANGNINSFVAVLGLSQEQIDNMQLCSCYRPNCERGLLLLMRRSGSLRKQLENDYRREILQKFMPFMSKSENGQFERYSEVELIENFSNIMIQAHCYGANDLPRFSKVFNETMTQLGYTDKEKQNALRQIVCISNNSQREFSDNLDFTLIHRYSVKDGQFEPEYEERFSDDYPVFLQQHPEFKSQTGRKSSFVSLRTNEILMIFDKILKQGNEHNSGFWTTNLANLTVVGKKQAELMQKIGQFWYSHNNKIPSVIDFIKKAVQGSNVVEYVEKSLLAGEKLRREQKNLLKNSHILKSAWNKFNSPDIVPENAGICKLLSHKSR